MNIHTQIRYIHNIIGKIFGLDESECVYQAHRGYVIIPRIRLIVKCELREVRFSPEGTFNDSLSESAYNALGYKVYKFSLVRVDGVHVSGFTVNDKNNFRYIRVTPGVNNYKKSYMDLPQLISDIDKYAREN